MALQMLTHLFTRLTAKVAHQEDGQDLVEYALILVFISIASIAALTALGPQIASIYTQISDALTA